MSYTSPAKVSAVTSQKPVDTINPNLQQQPPRKLPIMLMLMLMLMLSSKRQRCSKTTVAAFITAPLVHFFVASTSSSGILRADAFVFQTSAAFVGGISSDVGDVQDGNGVGTPSFYSLRRMELFASDLNSETPAPASVDASAILSSSKWPQIKEDLNNLPVFATVSPNNAPLAEYLIEVDGRPRPVSSFWCDIDDAKQACQKIQEDSNRTDLRAFPFPLGNILEQSLLGRAALFPSEKSLVDAGAPPGTPAEGQPVPLFGCMQVMQEDLDGGGDKLPLFLVKSEAEQAVSQVIQEGSSEEEDGSEFAVVGIALENAVELLALDDRAPPFHFIPPVSSVKYIRELQKPK